MIEMFEKICRLIVKGGWMDVVAVYFNHAIYGAIAIADLFRKCKLLGSRSKTFEEIEMDIKNKAIEEYRRSQTKDLNQALRVKVPPIST